MRAANSIPVSILVLLSLSAASAQIASQTATQAATPRIVSAANAFPWASTAQNPSRAARCVLGC